MKRWKQFFPLLRCPGCRRWLKLVSHGNYKLTLASKGEIASVAGDSATPPNSESSARVRVEGSE